MHHSRSLLEVANVCHPEVEPHHRRNVMLEVATREGMDGWVRRLEQRKGAGAMMAMHMLSQLEARGDAWVEGYTGEPRAPCWPSTHVCVCMVVVLTVVMVTLAIVEK
jgi:4'-phosphopantetheinyl transferase EntD